MDKTVTERPSQKVLLWRVSRGRTPCRIDYCGQFHDGDRHVRVPQRRIPCQREHSGEFLGLTVPVAQSRDGQDKVEELHTALTIVGELHDGEDHAKASYHGEGRDREPLPESPTMETTKSESPTRENAVPGRLSGECHDTEDPIGELCDGEDRSGKLHTT